MKTLVKTLLVATAVLFSSVAFGTPVNVNTATAEEISNALSGIGDKRAQDIVNYRKAHGPFTSAQELTGVKGIGEKTVAKNLQDIKL